MKPKKTASILKKFLLFNFTTFSVLGLITIFYLKAIQPNLVKERAINHKIIISNTIDHLKRLNNSIHYLISSVCISKNGSMIWNHTDSSELKMKNLTDDELNKYLDKIKTETLTAYGVYQIEANGLDLFDYVKGDRDSIMGLPIKEIINYINQHNK